MKAVPKASVLPLMNLEGCEGGGSDREELSVSSKSRRHRGPFLAAR